MIDFHSHILPKIDDGSKDESETEQLLSLLKAQGVDTVVASPHYKPNGEDSIKRFLKRRQDAFDKVKNDAGLKIKLGAEVAYYRGISKMSGISDLKIQDSDMVLIEMPFDKWSDYTFGEIAELSAGGDLRVVIAHLERYLGYQDFKKVEKLVFDSGVLVQSNADFFIDRFSRRKALRLLDSGIIRIIGSDCHNVETRRPQMDKAFSVIEAKFGADYVRQMNEYSKSLFIKE